MFYKKVFGVLGILCGVVGVALYSPILVANILWLVYALAALVALGTIATTNTKDYNVNSWTSRKVSPKDEYNTNFSKKGTLFYTKKNGVVVSYTL